MFNLKDFILQGLRDSIGKEPDYKVIQNTTGWLEKGVLEMSDIEEISNLINEKNKPVEVEEEALEENTEITEESTESTETGGVE